MSYSNKKLTPEIIEQYLDDTATIHNGMGAKMIKTLVDAKLNIVNLARAINTRPETAKKYRDLLKTK